MKTKPQPATSIASSRPHLLTIQRAIESHPGVSPSAVETAAELVGCWIDRFEQRDRLERTVATEVMFNVQLDPYTIVIGIIDRLSYDLEDGVLGVSEWKTTRGPSDHGGQFGWGERKWLQEITSGIQLPTYAMAAKHGRLILRKNERAFTIKDSSRLDTIRVRVRAAVKSSPPVFWPASNEYARSEPGLYDYDSQDIEACRHAYLNAAATIRLLRGKGYAAPWQHTGAQCFHQFGRDCSLLESCRVHSYPTGAYHIYDPHEDGFDYLAKFGLAKLKRDPRTIVLSPSSYQTWATCMEKWRVVKGVGEKEEQNDLALQIGGAFHRGISCFYELLKGGA